MTIIVHFTIEHQVLGYRTTGSLRNSMEKSGKILRGRKDTLAPWFQYCGGEDHRRPSIPTPLTDATPSLSIIIISLLIYKKKL